MVIASRDPDTSGTDGSEGRRRMPRTVITGGSGLRRLAPLRAVSGRGARRRLRRQPADRPPAEHRPPARRPHFSFVNHNVSEPITVDGVGRQRAPLRQPRQPGRLPGPPDRHAQGRLARHPQRPRPGQGQGRPLPPGQHLRGLRRPRRPPPARGLLGQRQPDRPQGLLRRGQAVRRGHHHGLPPLPRRQDPDRPDLQHLRPPDEAQRRPGPPRLHGPGA